MEVSINDIIVSDWNPRKDFNPDDLDELKASIKQYGILEPLVVRPQGDKYELVAGERRFRAAKNLNLEVIPVIIKDLTDTEVHEVMLIENLQRSNLQPLEEAISLETILKQDITQKELAKKLGKSQAWISNRLRLLSAPKNLKDMIISREISSKHVIILLPYAKYPVFNEIINHIKAKIKDMGPVSVRYTGELIEDAIKYRHNNKVLNLDATYIFSDDLRELFDFSNCDNCKDIVKYEHYNDEYHRFCLNTKCWKKNLSKAEKTLNKQKEEIKQRVLKCSGDPVDTTDLEYDEYEVFYSSNDFDMTECEQPCKSYRLSNKTDDYICVDPECYKKKASAVTRAKNKVEREEDQHVWAVVDKWLDTFNINDFDFAFALRTLISITWDKPIKKGLSRWGKLESTYGEDVTDFLTEMPDDDHHKAIIRLLLAQLFERSGKSGSDLLNEYVPTAINHYVEASA